MKEFTIFGRPFEFLTNESQWTKLHNFLNQYLFDNYWGNIALIIMAAVFAGFLLSLILHGRAKKTVNVLTLLAYAVVMVLLFVAVRETARGFRGFNLSDYLTDTGFHETRVLIGVVNGMFFVPFGILLRKASGKGHGFANVFLILLAAVGIEFGQYYFAKGYTAVEDVLVYLVGGFSGLIIASPFCLVSEYLENRRRRSRINRNYRNRNHRDRQNRRRVGREIYEY